MKIDTQHFKEVLGAMKMKLEEELEGMGHKNPANAADWQINPVDSDKDRADEGEVAESIEESENNNAQLQQLETQLKEVNDSLEDIENGSYGICRECEAEIEVARLEANPAAKTCEAHKEL